MSTAPREQLLIQSLTDRNLRTAKQGRIRRRKQTYHRKTGGAVLEFKSAEIYKRSLIHEEYGGNRQSGISYPAKHYMVFIFTGFSGEEYGYNDRWENGYFLYYGEGQEGDMEFVRVFLATKKYSTWPNKNPEPGINCLASNVRVLQSVTSSRENDQMTMMN